MKTETRRRECGGFTEVSGVEKDPHGRESGVCDVCGHRVRVYRRTWEPATYMHNPCLVRHYTDGVEVGRLMRLADGNWYRTHPEPDRDYDLCDVCGGAGWWWSSDGESADPEPCYRCSPTGRA